MSSNRAWRAAIAASAVALLPCAPLRALSLTRGPYVGRPSDTRIAIAWRTDVPSTSRVDYGLEGETPLSAGSDDAVARHVVEIGDLQSGAVYQYQVFSDGVPLADISTFRAPRDASETSFRFGVIGDTAAATDAQRDVPRRIADRLVESGVDFVIHMGDVVYPSGAESGYDEQFFVPLAHWLRVGPVLPALGNHDVRSARGEPFLTDFALPANGVTRQPRFYAFRQANALFVCLDVESSRFGEGSAQSNWLKKTLRDSDATWKLVYFHEPPFSSHVSNHLVRLMLCPVFERLGVDVAFSGHVHLWERTWPLREFGGAGPGVVYVTEGGSGSPLTPFTAKPFSAFAASRHGWAEVQVEGGRLTILARDPDGAVFDSVVIEKP